MKLIITDCRLSEACREIEERSHLITALSEASIIVRVEPDFNHLAEKYRRNEALFDSKTKRILINNSLFFKREQVDQVAILVHEIGHWHIDDQCIDTSGDISLEEVLADSFCIVWGFINNIRSLRGERYTEADYTVLERNDVGELLRLAIRKRAGL